MNKIRVWGHVQNRMENNHCYTEPQNVKYLGMNGQTEYNIF